MNTNEQRTYILIHEVATEQATQEVLRSERSIEFLIDLAFCLLMT